MTTTKPTTPRKRIIPSSTRAGWGTLTVGAFRMRVEPESDNLARVTFGGEATQATLLALGIALRSSAVRWGAAWDVMDALRSNKHERGGPDGDVLASLHDVFGGEVRLTVASAEAPDCGITLAIAQRRNGRIALNSEPATIDAAQLGAIGQVFETLASIEIRETPTGLHDAVAVAMASLRCGDLDDALRALEIEAPE